MPTERTCFVISPIGASGSDVREHADTVFKYIIEPATAARGIKAVRADQIREPGRISDDMYRHILNDDICIVLLTGGNPNVYYELAVAQSAARPIIMLQQLGEPVPFDIKDYRFVEYDFLPKRLIDEQVYATRLIEHIDAIADADWTVPCPIPGMSEAWARNAELDFFAQSSSFGPHAKWLQLLQDTTAKFFIMGLTLRSWTEGEDLPEVLLRKAADGCDIRVLLMHPDNPALPLVISQGRPSERIAKTKLDIVDVFSFFGSLAEKETNIKVRQAVTGCTMSQITVTDNAAILIPYLFGAKSSASPLYHTGAHSPLYRRALKEFEALWDANSG